MAVMVDVGGYQLAADLVLGADPLVVFLSGIGEGRTVWQNVVDLLDSNVAILVYDRAGIGDSGQRAINDTPLPFSALAGELAALLDGLQVDQPVVLVAHSFGAVVARSFAASDPNRVAGLVLVDGAVDDVILWPGSQPPQDGRGPQATLLDYQAGAAELQQAGYRRMPAVVLTRTPGNWTSPEATAEVDARWSGHQAAGQLDATLIVADNAGHQLHHEAAGMVATAVRAVVAAVRSGEHTVRVTSSDLDGEGRVARCPV